MKVEKSKLVALIVAGGFPKAKSWSDSELKARIQKIGEMVEDEDLEDPEHKELLAAIIKAKPEKVEIVGASPCKEVGKAAKPVQMEMQTAEPLSDKEQSRKEELEKEIKSGISSFVAIGNALLEIRENNLFRAEYPNFEAYLKGKWGLSKSYGYQLSAGAEVAKEVPKLKSVKSSVVREVTKVKDKAKRKEAAEEVVKASEEKAARKEKFTAKDAKKVVAKVTGKPVKEEKKKLAAPVVKAVNPRSVIKAWWEKNEKRMRKSTPKQVYIEILNLFK